MSARRVLVIMAKAPRPGRVKTRLLSCLSPGQVDALYRCLVEDTVTLALGLGDVHVAVMCPAGERDEMAALVAGRAEIVSQEGTGLARALTSVFRHFVGAGYDRIVAFNSDSPHLPVSVLRSAFEALEAHDTVVGPTLDGGYYLVGARAAHEGLFDGDRLGTSSALDALRAGLARQSLTTAQLPEWYDVDVASDLERLAAELRAEPRRAARTAALLARWAEETAD